MTFRTTKVFDSKGSAYKTGLTEEYLRQRIDDEINSRLYSPPAKNNYHPTKVYGSSVYERSQLSPSSIQERLVSNISMREQDSNSRKPLQTSTLSPRRLSPSYQSPSRDQRISAYQSTFEEERRQREARKRAIMRKIEELNDKFNYQSSQIHSFSSQTLPKRHAAPVSPSYSNNSQTINYSVTKENRTIETENKSSQPQEENPRILKSQASNASQVSVNESKLKLEIQNLEATNNSLKQQVEKLESQHEEITQKLKESLKQSQSENVKLQEQLKQQAEEGKATLQAEKKKDQDNLKQVQKLESDRIIALKQTYEEKLIAAQGLLQEAANRAQESQELKNEEQILLAIQNNPEILDILSSKLQTDKPSNGTTDEKLLERIASMELLLQKKDEMIRETSKNSELKSLEISKMEELIEKFKALFQHMNEEKEILTAENDRLSEESDQLKAYFEKLISQVPNGEEYNEEEGGEHGEVQELEEEEDEDHQNGGDNQIDENSEIPYDQQNGDHYEEQDGEQQYEEDNQEEMEEVDQDGQPLGDEDS